MRTRDEKLAQRRRQQIVNAAIGCFVKSGFHGTGMKEICKAAALSPGAVYRYFPGKDDIINVIVESEQSKFQMAIEELWQAPNLKKALFQFVDEAVRESCRPSDNILATEIFAEAGRNKRIATLLRQNEEALLDELEKLLAHGERIGQLTLTLNHRDTAQSLVALLYGLSGSALLRRKFSGRKAAALAAAVMEKIIL